MRFAFHSCMGGMPWGGSEELWYLAARQLQDQGHDVLVNYQWWPDPADKLMELQEAGADITFRGAPAKLTRFGWVGGLRRFVSKPNTPSNFMARQGVDMLLVTAGYHPDQIPHVSFCLRKQIPYAINVQCASHSVFINERRLESFREAYSKAAKVFFVSEENRHKLETNLAMKLTNAEIVCNPFDVSPQSKPCWPDESDPLRLACVGRIHFVSKGQDLIVDVLRQEKWRARNLKVSIFGSDQGNERQLRELVKLHHLEDTIEFAGYSNSVEAIWKNHHGLLLPSRYEGAALVVVESMMCHRMAITTDIGRNRELIDDNESGFVAAAPTVELLDEALERAWQRRSEWREIGLRAGSLVRERFCLDPIGDFSERLLAVAKLKPVSTPTA